MLLGIVGEPHYSLTTPTMMASAGLSKTLSSCTALLRQTDRTGLLGPPAVLVTLLLQGCGAQAVRPPTTARQGPALAWGLTSRACGNTVFRAFSAGDSLL